MKIDIMKCNKLKIMALAFLMVALNLVLVLNQSATASASIVDNFPNGGGIFMLSIR